MSPGRSALAALLLALCVLGAGCGDSETTTVTETVTVSEPTTTDTEAETTTEDVVDDCEDLSVNISGISVRNISCDDALRLLTENLGTVSRTFALGGFECARISGGRLGGIWRCTDGDQAIRFSFGD